MKRLLLSVCIPALTFFGFSLKAHAAETHSAPAFMNAEGEGIFPKGKTNDAYAQYFNGTSYLQALSTEGVAIANVTFEPGCRNFWHIHRKGGQSSPRDRRTAAGTSSGKSPRGRSSPATW